MLPTELINFKRRVSITQAPKLLLNIKRRTSVQVYEDALYGKRTYIDAGDVPVSEGTLYGKRTCTEVLPHPSNTHEEESSDVNEDLERFFDRQLLSSEAPMAACMNGLHTSVQASRRGSATLTSTGSTEFTAECGYSDTVLTPMPRAGSSKKLVVGTSMQELQTPSASAAVDNEDSSLKTTPSPTTTALQLDSPSDSPFHDSNGKLKSDFTVDQLSPKNGLFSVLGPQSSSSPFPTTTTLYSVHTPSLSGGPRGYKHDDGISPPTETFTPFSDNKKMSNIDHNRSNSPDISRGGFFPPISPVRVSENISLVSPYRPAGYPTEPDSACSQSSSTTHTFSAHSTPEIIPSYNSRDSFQGSNPRLSTRPRSPSQQDIFPVDPVKGENNKKLFDTAHMIGVQRAEVLETGRWSIKIPTINRWRHPSQTGANTISTSNNNRAVTDNEMDVISGSEKNVLESHKEVEEYSSGAEGSSGYMQYFFEEEHLADRMSKSSSACVSPHRSLPQPLSQKEKVVCVVENKKDVENEMKGESKRVQLSSGSNFTTASSLSSAAPVTTLSSSLPSSLPTTTTTTTYDDDEPTNYAGVILKSISTKDVIPPFRLTGDESESDLEESPDNSETKINTAMNRSIAACAALNSKYDQKITSSKPTPLPVTAPVTVTVPVPLIVKKIEETNKVEVTNNNNNDDKKIRIIENGEFIKQHTQVQVSEKEEKKEKEIYQHERKVELKKTGIIGLWDVNQKDGNTINTVKTVETVKAVETEITIVRREESRVRSTSSNFEARVVKKLDFDDNDNDDYLDNNDNVTTGGSGSGVQHFCGQGKDEGDVKEIKRVEEIEKIIEKTEKRKSGAINLWEAKKKAVKDEEDRKEKEEKEGEKGRDIKKDEKNKPRAFHLWEQKSAAVKLNSNTINGNNNPNLKNNSNNNNEVAAKTEKNVGRLAGFFNREKSDNKIMTAHSWLSKKVPSFRNEKNNEVEKEVVVSSNKKEMKLWDQKNLKNTIKINKSVSNSSHKSANSMKNNSVKKSHSKNEKEGGDEGDNGGEESGSECLDLWPDDDMTEDGDRQHNNEEEVEEEEEGENETDSVTVVMDKTWRVEASMTGESSVEGESITVLKMGDIHEDTEEVEDDEKVVRKVEKEVENGKEDTSFLNISEESSDALVSVSLHSNGSHEGKGKGEEGGDKDEGKGVNEGKQDGKGKEKEKEKKGGVFSMIGAVMTTPMKGKTAAKVQ